MCVYILLACFLAACFLIRPRALFGNPRQCMTGLQPFVDGPGRNLSQRRHFIATDFLACLPTFVSLVRQSLSIKNSSIFLGSEVALLANHVDER